MLIHVSGKGLVVRSELQDQVEEKIDMALNRFHSRIGKVNAYLEDVNGPKSGKDKLLRLIIDVKRIPLVVIEERGESWRALIDSTVERAAHTISRQIERLRSRGGRTSMAGNPPEADVPEHHITTPVMSYLGD